jgi:4-aminobutyrate aminotransferase-like enzyme
MTIRSNFFKHIAKTSPFPLGFEVSASRGSCLIDEHGKTFLDFISGIGVSNLGHGHPEILQAIHTQADRYLHTMVYGEHIQSPQVLLAKTLCDHLPATLNQVYFLSSGTEAIETALKLARKITKRSKIISCRNAYHGSTYGSMSLMSDPL